MFLYIWEKTASAFLADVLSPLQLPNKSDFVIIMQSQPERKIIIKMSFWNACFNTLCF